MTSRLQPHETLYQRLLARDQDEARQIALAHVQKEPAEHVFDVLLVPVLSYLKRDLKHDRLTAHDEEFMLRILREIIDELAERIGPDAQAVDQENAESGQATAEPRVRVVVCPADGAIDALAIDMLRLLLSPQRWNVHAVSDDTLAGELLESISEQDVPLVCFGTVAPASLAHIRYFCKRLRSYRADVKIMVGRWGAPNEEAHVEEQLDAAGADRVARTLLETSKNLEAWWPLLAGRREAPAGEEHSSKTRVASQ